MGRTHGGFCKFGDGGGSPRGKRNFPTGCSRRFFSRSAYEDGIFAFFSGYVLLAGVEGEGRKKGERGRFFLLDLVDLQILRALRRDPERVPVRSRARVYLSRKDCLLPKTILSR